MIYADHAATTKMSAEAMAAMVKGWEVYGNPSSLHTIGQEAAVVLQKAREQIAVCLDADPKEIYFTSGGSEAAIRHFVPLQPSASGKDTCTLSPQRLNIMRFCTRWNS